MAIKIFGSIKGKLNQIFSLATRQTKINSYLNSTKIPKLQLGGGFNFLEGWLNTDLVPSPNTVFLNVKKSFPFKNDVFNYIFCEHLIEHLTYAEGRFMLQECFRVIKPGGTLRIATPDLRFLIELYAPEKTETQKQYISWAMDSFLPGIEDPEDTFVINNFFQNWGHKFIYDFKILDNTLKRAGFANVTVCSEGDSDDINLQSLESHGKIIPDEFNKLETMVVEAEKPR